MQLEINAEHRNSRLGKIDQDLIHAHRHYAADALHNDRRQPHLIDAADRLPIGAKAAKLQTHLMVFQMVQNQRSRHAAALANHRCPRRACYAHRRQAHPAEDQNGVQRNVCERAHHLADHLIDRFARHLQHPLHGDRQEQPERKHRSNAQIGRTAG